tara:strand:- start:954 stop:1292 length:339 start_codon:yes stop_codon:yes gene_type:complete
MKVKNLIIKLIETNFNIDQEVYIELWEDTEDGYKCLKIPIDSVDESFDNNHGFGFESKGTKEDLILLGEVKKAFIYKWEKRKCYPVNVPSGMESYFPIKKKIKLNLPKETEK